MKEEKKSINIMSEVGKSFTVLLLYLFLPVVIVLFIKDSSSTLFNVVTYLMFLILFTFLYRKALIEDFKDLKKNFKKYHNVTIKYLIYGFLVMAMSNLIINGLINNDIPANEEINRSLLRDNPLIWTFILAILAPIIEEIVFRLSFRNVFKNKLSFAIFNALLFGGLHLVASFDSLTATSIIENWRALLSIIPYGALGFTFAYIYFETRNIYSSILAHCYNNSFTVILLLVTQFLERF